MAELSIVIPFCNEGDEVYKTCGQLLDTKDKDIEIVLVNDYSDDGYDYRNKINSSFKNVILLENYERKGVAYSRDLGAEKSSSKYFLSMDAHMAIIKDHWTSFIIDTMKSNPNTILCGNTMPLTVDRKIKKKATVFGCRFSFENGVACKWTDKDRNPVSDIVDIDCVLGACYTYEKDTYFKLHGLNGERGYGLDEEMISMKYHCTGGKCILSKSLGAGHIYRQEQGTHPFVRYQRDMVYNKLLFLNFFCDEEEKVYKDIYDGLITGYTDKGVDEAKKLYIDNIEWIEKEKAYIRSLFVKDYREIRDNLMYNRA
jgi:glycosyltransferase involved in cell wall biosynthesis